MEFRGDSELKELRDKYSLSSARKGYGEFEGYTLPEDFAKYRKEIEEFEVYEDDVWVCSYPKSGTTWMQELVWCVANGLDFEAAKVDLDDRFPFMEFCVFFGMDDPDNAVPYMRRSIEFLKSKPRPRFIKTHLPWELMPKQIRTFEKRPKIIHVARNPKDVCVSHYHHVRYVEYYSGDFDLHVQLFLKNKATYTPFFETVLGYWSRRSEPNIVFLKYEDMKRDLRSVLLRIAEFLGFELDEDQVRKLQHHLSFEVMRHNRATDHSTAGAYLMGRGLILNLEGEFMRSGTSGSYKSDMSKQVVDYFDRWTEENLAGTGLEL